MTRTASSGSFASCSCNRRRNGGPASRWLIHILRRHFVRHNASQPLDSCKDARSPFRLETPASLCSIWFLIVSCAVCQNGRAVVEPKFLSNPQRARCWRLSQWPCCTLLAATLLTAAAAARSSQRSLCRQASHRLVSNPQEPSSNDRVSESLIDLAAWLRLSSPCYQSTKHLQFYPEQARR